MNKKLQLAAAIIFTVAGIAYAYPYFSTASNKSLLATALSGTSEEARLRAAQSLCERNRLASPEIKELAETSKDEDIVILALLAMSRNYNYDGVEVAFGKLDSESSKTRKAAAKSLAVFLGADHKFPSDANKETREQVKAKMLAEWNRYKNSKLFEINKTRLTGQ